MAGILAVSAYVPRYRLPREVIAKEWGGAPGPGERAVANHDEDSLTMAVNAALNALPDGAARGVDAIYFASTTPPYREKQSATTVAAVLDAGNTVRTADFTDSLRAGTSALRAALDAVAAGSKRALVCAGDCRMGEPDSIAERASDQPPAVSNQLLSIPLRALELAGKRCADSGVAGRASARRQTSQQRNIAYGRHHRIRNLCAQLPVAA